MGMRPNGGSSADTDAIFTPIRTANAFEQTVERIGRAIKMGLLRPSERLPSERDLALQLALSRSTVREALRVLAEAGYLEARRGRGGGTFVAEVLPQLEARDPHDVLRELGSTLGDTLVLRRVLEVGSAELAAEHATRADVERLAQLIDEVAEFDAGSYPSYRAVDSRLHIAIAAISGSLQLVEAITQTHGVISDVMNGMPRSNETLDNSTAQHHRLLAAIESHDRDAARVVMREHVEGIERLISGLTPVP
jgi:DNA-binding FadR family transcriptional regulator